MTPDLTPLLEAFADMVAARVVEHLRATNEGMISQAESPLGRRRHCAAVQRRVVAGSPGAAIVGRKHLLSQAALSEELSNLRPSKEKATPAETRSITGELSEAITQPQRSNTDVSVGKVNGSRRHAPSSKSSNRNGAQ